MRIFDLMFASLVLSINSISNSKTQEQYIPDEDQLLDYLDAECSIRSSGRPVANASEPMVVEMKMIPYSFRGLIDRQQHFSIIAEIDLFWKHPCVRWGHNEATKHWRSIVRLQDWADRYWRPGIPHDNAVFDQNILNNMAKNSPILIYPDGTIAWQVVTILDSICQMEFVFILFCSSSEFAFFFVCNFSFEKFPFDSQECNVYFESFLNDNILNIKLRDSGIELTGTMDEFISLNEIWQLVNYSAQVDDVFYETWNGTFDVISFRFQLDRKYQLYTLTIFLPCICLTLLQLAAGIMPPKYPDRAAYNITGIKIQ